MRLMPPPTGEETRGLSELLAHSPEEATLYSVPETLTCLFPFQLFHVAYILLKFANSPRPDLWVLERSVDHGKTFTPWQYFARKSP